MFFRLTWVRAAAPAMGKTQIPAMTGNRSLYLLVSQMETSKIQIPRTPVGICMRIAFNEVWLLVCVRLRG